MKYMKYNIFKEKILINYSFIEANLLITIDELMLYKNKQI